MRPKIITNTSVSPWVSKLTEVHGCYIDSISLLILCVYKCMFDVSDLKTMTDRLKNRYYVHKRLFMADMQRIFRNCRDYNDPDTEYYKCANTLEKYFFSKLKESVIGDSD